MAWWWREENNVLEEVTNLSRACMLESTPIKVVHSTTFSAVAGHEFGGKKTRSEAVITWSAPSSPLLLPETDPAASGRSGGAAIASPNVCRSAASPTRSPPPRMAIKSCTVRVFQRACVSRLEYHKHDSELDVHESIILL